MAVPAGLKTGTYRIDVKTYYDTDQQSDSQTVLLAVSCEEKKPVDLCAGLTYPVNTKACADGFEAECTQNCVDGSFINCEPDCTGHTVAAVTTPEKKPFSSTPWYIAGLVVLNVLVVGIGAAVITRLLRR